MIRLPERGESGHEGAAIIGRTSRRVAVPAAEFPVIDDIDAQQTVQIPRVELQRLLEKTHFSMA